MTSVACLDECPTLPDEEVSELAYCAASATLILPPKEKALVLTTDLVLWFVDDSHEHT